MLKKNIKKKLRIKRKYRIRKNIFGFPQKPRLSIFKSNKHIYIQAIDDYQGKTLVSFSSISKYFKIDLNYTKKQLSFFVGLIFGKKLIKLGINKGIIDRNGFFFSERLSKLVDGIKKSGFYI